MTKQKPSIKERLYNLYAKVFNAKLSRKGKIQLVATILAIVALIALGVWSFNSHGVIYDIATFIVDQEAVEAWITSMGIWGPLAFILLQIAQTVISPIPGNIVGFVGGLLFGWWGVLLSTVGSTIGYAIVLVLVRRFGRDLVEKLISKELLDKFDYLASEKGLAIFFLIFLIPALPDDVVMCIAGLTKIPIRQLLFMAAVGRFPSVVVTNQLGNSIGSNEIGHAIALAIFSLIIVGLCLWKRDAIMNLASARREILEERWQHFCADIKRAFERLFAKIPTPHKRAAKKRQKTAQKAKNSAKNQPKSIQNSQSKSHKHGKK